MKKLTALMIIFFSLFMIQKKRERLRTDTAYARRLSAPRKAKRGINEAQRFMKQEKTQEFFGAVSRTIREYLGDRFHLPAGGITAEIIDTGLKEKNMDEAELEKLRNIFRECDMARFAPSALGRADMEKTLQDLREVIDYMERHTS